MNNVLKIRGMCSNFKHDKYFHDEQSDNLKVSMQSCKWLEPKHVMKNDSHARVVRSVIKTAGNNHRRYCKKSKLKKGKTLTNELRFNLGISGSQKLRYLSSKTCPIMHY